MCVCQSQCPLSIVHCRVVTLEHDHEVAMRGALSALRSDTDQRTGEAVRVAREEEKEAGLRAKEAALEELRQQHLAAMQMEEEKLNDMKQKWEQAEEVRINQCKHKTQDSRVWVDCLYILYEVCQQHSCVIRT